MTLRRTEPSKSLPAQGLNPLIGLSALGNLEDLALDRKAEISQRPRRGGAR